MSRGVAPTTRAVCRYVTSPWNKSASGNYFRLCRFPYSNGIRTIVPDLREETYSYLRCSSFLFPSLLSIQNSIEFCECVSVIIFSLLVSWDSFLETSEFEVNGSGIGFVSKYRTLYHIKFVINFEFFFFSSVNYTFSNNITSLFKSVGTIIGRMKWWH